jgi:hypothetical protein
MNDISRTLVPRSASVRGVVAAMVLLAAAAACSSVEPNRGDPPLTGDWVTKRPCSVDVPCGWHLRLEGSTITGDYWQRSPVGGFVSSQPVSGTFVTPAVHLAWGDPPYRFTFDGTWQSDSLMVGVLTPPVAAYADTTTLVKRP